MASTILAAWEVLPLASSVGKVSGIAAAGKMVDEQGNIYLADAACVLGPELDGVGAGDDIFPSVPGNVIVDTHAPEPSAEWISRESRRLPRE